MSMGQYQEFEELANPSKMRFLVKVGWYAVSPFADSSMAKNRMVLLWMPLHDNAVEASF